MSRITFHCHLPHPRGWARKTRLARLADRSRCPPAVFVVLIIVFVFLTAKANKEYKGKFRKGEEESREEEANPTERNSIGDCTISSEHPRHTNLAYGTRARRRRSERTVISYSTVNTLIDPLKANSRRICALRARERPEVSRRDGTVVTSRAAGYIRGG